MTTRSWAKRIFRDNGLSLVLAAIFLCALTAQTLAGWLTANEENHMHKQPAVGLGKYLASGDFGEAVFENWESEFLQMAVYVVLTAFLYQRGSAESKDPDEIQQDNGKTPVPAPSPVPGGWRFALYRHSLSLTLFTLFVLSFVGHAFTGASVFNEEASEHGMPGISVWEYLISSRFWFESLQNWQSEFLAIFSLVVLSIWLREEGSPESKSVFAAHAKTGK